MDKVRDAVREKTYLKCLEEIQKIRHFEGDPAHFWGAYLACMLPICETDTGIIAVRTKMGAPGWRILAVSPDRLFYGGTAEAMMEEIQEATGRCLERGSAHLGSNEKGVLAIRLRTGSEEDGCLAVFFSPVRSQGEIQESLKRLELVSDVPADYQLSRVAAESTTQVRHFANVMDLMVLLNAEKRFLSASMAFCNEIATRHRCERVSLGWLDRGYIRLQAISRVDRFERKTEAVQKLEAAMEEALDQNAEVALPSNEAGGPIRRDHEAYMAACAVSHICSLPMRTDGEATAVCTCERSGAPFTETELRLLRLSCDQASRRLSDLKRNDKWFGARAASAIKDALSHVLGYTHTWAKVLVVLVAAALGVVFFATPNYRVKTAATLRTEDLVHLTAPFDGRIDSVQVRVGDIVKKGQALLALDQTDLLLQEAEQIAEDSRYAREVEKAQGSGALADMRIAMAQREQSAARLALIRHQIEQSTIRAAFDGVIVGGDLLERVGSPVRQGEPLFKLGRLENLYAELEVNEADIHEIGNAQAGELALSSRPQEKFGITVTRIEPMAMAKEKKNVFIVKAAFAQAPRDWWRPGMSGVARLAVGRRSLLWIISHSTLDFLRLRLWW